MTRKKKINPEAELPTGLSESDKVRQDIANLCTTIGDRSFVIRETESEIVRYYAQIDSLREKLRTLEAPANGSENAK